MGSGHKLEKKSNKNHMRIILQNPNGLGNVNGVDNVTALQDLKNVQADIVCLPETNVNWGNPHECDRWRAVAQRTWPKSKILNASIKGNDRTQSWQPGGVSMIISSKYASMISASGADKMGRWVWATFGSGNEKVTIITVYRVCEGSQQTEGPSTAWSQQRDFMVNKMMTEDAPITEIDNVDPRDMTNRDLHSFIQKCREGNGKIILAGDMNQDMYATQRGKLSTGSLCEKSGLYSVAYGFENELRPSHIRGSKVIDHICLGGIVTEHLVRAGQLPHRTMFATSDHRAMFADIDISAVLKAEVDEIEPRSRRRLVSKNKKRVRQYIAEVLRRFHGQEVPTVVAELYKKAKGKTFQEVDKTEYNKIDRVITEILVKSEKLLPAKNGTGWNPALSQVTYRIRYLRVLRRCTRGFRTSDRALYALSERAKTKFYSQDYQEIGEELRRAWKDFKSIKEKAVMEREQHLTELLTESQMECDDTRARAIEGLRKSEKMSRRQQRINRVAGKVKRGVRTVYVPNEHDPEGGSWTGLSGKAEIEESLIKQNVDHLQKAGETPFAHGERYESLRNEFVRDDIMDDLLTGETDWTHPIEEVDKWIRELEYQYDRNILREEAKMVGDELTYQEYRDHFKGKKEATESSKSGRHMGHYKAGLDSEELTEIHLMMMNIPILCGFAGERWRKSIAVMVAKDEGRTKINRMRIIQLLEADLNAVLGIIFGKRLVQFAVKYCNLNPSQFGRPGTLCQSAVINKVLSFEIGRICKNTTTAMEVDAEGCYDRMVPELVAVTCRRLGMPATPCWMLIDCLNNMEHCVRTQLGQSTTEYKSEFGKFLFGTGQGSGGSPAFWLSTSETILNAMDRHTSGITLTNPAGSIQQSRTEDKFIDDASLMTNGNDPEEVVSQLQKNAQMHERFLFSTGGRLALHKCFWTMVEYQWRDGKATILPYRAQQRRETDTEDKSVKLTQGGNFSNKIVIKRIGEGDAYRTLGVFLAADGNQRKQKDVLIGKSRLWSVKMDNSNLTNEEKLLSYQQQLTPSLEYPLPCTSLTKDQLRSVQFPSLKVATNALGLNSTFPRAILFGDYRYQGLQMSDLYVKQGTEKLRYYVGHLRTNTETSKLLRIEKDYVELISGRGKCPLEFPEINRDSWAQKTWIHSLGLFLDESDGKIITDGERVIGNQRVRDINIMDQVDNLSSSDQDKVQECRLFLNVQCLSDICNAEGTTVIPQYLEGVRVRASKLRWPEQGRPHKRSWKVWKRLVKKFTVEGSTRLRQEHRLGDWLRTHQVWDWTGSNKCVRQRTTATIYKANGRGRRPQGSVTAPMTIMDEHPADVNMKRDGTVVIEFTQASNGNHSQQDAGGDTILNRYQREIGRIRTNSTLNCVSGCHAHIVGVSDGSVKDGEGSAGYVLHTMGTDEKSLEASLPVDGSPETMSSYQTELAGILAMHLATKIITNRSKDTDLSGEFYCDNLRAVERINEVDDSYPFSIKQATEKDHDLLNEIRRLRDGMKEKFPLRWVKGHVEHPTNVQEHLNRRADTLANQHRDLSLDHRGKPTGTRLPNQPVLVTFGDTGYYGDYAAVARRHYFGGEAEQYIARKFSIPTSSLRDIDWETIRRTTKNMKPSQRATKAKFTFRWNYTKVRGFLFNEEDSELCPLCNAAQETNQHVLRCGHEKVLENRDDRLADLATALRTIGTQKDMVRLMMTYVSTTEPIPLDLVRYAPCENGFRDLMTRQSLIGDGNWECGWWSCAWKEQHDRLRKNGHRAKYSGDKWAPRAQAMLWEYVRSLWVRRNEVIHGANEEEERQVRRMRLERQVEDLYDGRPRVGNKSALFANSKSEMLRKGSTHLKNWIKRVETAVRVEERRRLRTRRNRNTIRRWLVQREGPQTCSPTRTEIDTITQGLMELTLKDTG